MQLNEKIKVVLFSFFDVNVSQSYYNNSGDNFMKNEVVHARVQSDVKVESEKVLSAIGITLSQAIDLFLRQVILKKGIPFKLDSEEKEENDISKLAYLINTVDGKEPSSKAKKIINLYARGDIDLDTAKYSLTRMHQQ